MTEQKKLLDDVKCEIRSVLLTAPNGFDLHKLNKEYSGMIGRPIPFQKLGYSKLEEFLVDIPDVVQARYSYQLGANIFKGVADETTKHIAQMVSKQKNSKQSKSTAPRFNRGAVYAVPARRSVPPRMKSTSSPIYDSAWAKPAKSAPPIIPANVKSDIMLLLYDYPEGIRFQGFLQAFRKKFGKELCYEKMGFMTLHTCLEQVSGLKIVTNNNELQVCLANGTRPKEVSQKPKPVKYVPPPRFSGSEKSQSQGSLNSHSESSVSNSYMEQQRKNHDYTEQERLTQNRSIPKPINTSKIGDLDDFSENSAADYKPSSKSANINQSCTVASNISHQSQPSLERLGNNLCDAGSCISDRMKNNFITLLNRHPQGIWSSEFPNKYQELTGNIFDLPSLGYYSLIEMVDQYPEIFVRYRPTDCKSDWKLYSVDRDPTKQSGFASSSPIAAANILVLDEVVANIRKLLQSYPEGVYLDDIMHLYNLNFEAPLVISDFGYEDLETFLQNISKSVPLKIKYSNVRKKVYFGYEPTLYQSRSPTTRALYLETPNDAILPGVFYERQKLPQNIPEFLSVYIGTISNPSVLWIQLKGEETSGSLGKLMEAIDCFYNEPRGNAYRMDERHITIGAVCAGIWSNDHSWHRISIIAAATDQNFVEAEFVDYGTVEKVLKKDLRFLKSDFFKFPAQAIKARMADLKPINGRSWNPRARDRILELCKDKALMAEVKYEPKYPGILSVYLCDTSQEHDVFIHQVLIDEGFAVHERMSSHTDQENAFTSNFYSNYGIAQDSASSGIIPAPVIPSINAEAWEKAQLLSQLKAASTVVQNEVFLEDMMRVLNLSDSSDSVNRSSTLVAIIRMLMSCNDPTVRQALLTAVDKLASGMEMPGNCYPNNHQQSFLNNYLSQHQQANPIPVNQGRIRNKLDVNFNMSINPPRERSKDDSPDSSDTFEDDDEQFKEFCSEKKTKHFVKRVKLHGGYKIHIISVDKTAYVSCGDVSHLFWKNQSWDHLYRRLRIKSIVITSKTISDIEYPEVLDQVKNFRVIGVKEEDGRSEIMLYPLENVIDIINIFGHSSTTIRDEIEREIHDFHGNWEDSVDSFTFEDTDDEDQCYDTDSNKFQRLCVYDLESTTKGLNYKRDKLMKELDKGKNIEEIVESIRKIEGQMKIYENRINEIKALSLPGR